MSAAAGRRGRRRRGGGEHDNEERWLLTYADMITLLMALFMVLFSISAVNKSKLQSLQQSLQQAFSGQILPGGVAIRDNGGGSQTQQVSAQPAIPAIQPLVGTQVSPSGQPTLSPGVQQPQQQEQSFERLKREIDRWAQTHGLANQVETLIQQRGLVIRLLTDQVLFDSAQAELKPEAHPILGRVAELLRTETRNPIGVEGHTDDVPITGSVYPTNWELSTARASRVVRFLVDAGVDPLRLSAAGYGWLHPIASNATEDGRSHNRRVEIVLLRSGQGTAGGGSQP
jgi:chemotaxis protein MotB